MYHRVWPHGNHRGIICGINLLHIIIKADDPSCHSRYQNVSQRRTLCTTILVTYLIDTAQTLNLLFLFGNNELYFTRSHIISYCD